MMSRVIVALVILLTSATILGCNVEGEPIDMAPMEDAGMPNNQLLQPPTIAAGILLSSVSTPLGKAQGSFGAVFQHSGVGFWEIDFAPVQPGLNTALVLVSINIISGPGVAGFQYGAVWSGGPLLAISTFRSDTNAQADCDLSVEFKLLPLQR